MRNKHIYFFVGTTAEFIKLAPVIKELKDRKIDFKLITSGQNKILFKELSNYLGKVDAHISFKPKSAKSSVLGFAIWGIRTIFASLFYLSKEFKGLNKKKCYFIVHGDTVTSLLGAFIAKIYGLHLVHIESGLRSFNFFEPFPEEISRYIVSRLADTHFCPNNWCVDNLKSVYGEKINTKQNTLIGSLLWATKIKKSKRKFKIKDSKYFVLVMHRQEHVIFGRQKSKEILESVFKSAPKDLTCVFIVHDVTKSFLKSIGYKPENKLKERILFIPRLPYVDFIKLVEGSEFIVTDGGSNQEESYYLGKPCLILRNKTERIEGLGENAVLSRNNKRTIAKFLKTYRNYERKPVTYKTAPSKIIVDCLLTYQ